MKSPVLYICAECANIVCESAGTNRTCVNCGGFVPNRVTIKGLTNADRIRAMSDEELAKFLAEKATDRCAPNHYDCYPWDHCGECWLDWLKQEADG